MVKKGQKKSSESSKKDKDNLEEPIIKSGTTVEEQKESQEASKVIQKGDKENKGDRTTQSLLLDEILD